MSNGLTQLAAGLILILGLLFITAWGGFLASPGSGGSGGLFLGTLLLLVGLAFLFTSGSGQSEAGSIRKIERRNEFRQTENGGQIRTQKIVEKREEKTHA